ncbi:MAG: HNH endonuclease [Bacteriovoracaceae bacterium]|nr:HNH endonuclease [Bacteriovoracaceae bacterium]
MGSKTVVSCWRAWRLKVIIEKMSDDKLLKSVLLEVKKERDQLHIVLLHLKEIYRRRLFTEYNCRTLNEYCVKELGYTRGEAYYRVTAMKLMANSDQIEKAIKKGDLSLTAAVVASDYLTKQPDKSVKKKEEVISKIVGVPISKAKEILSTPPSKPEHPPKNELTPKLKVSKKVLKLLKELQDLTGEDQVKLLEVALENKLKQVEKCELKAIQGPSPIQSARSRYIPQAIKRKIRSRANYTCEHVSTHRGRCTESRNLEFDHHVTAYSKGGGNTLENLRLVCKNHNTRQFVLDFGSKSLEKITQKI